MTSTITISVLPQAQHALLTLSNVMNHHLTYSDDRETAQIARAMEAWALDGMDELDRLRELGVK